MSFRDDEDAQRQRAEELEARVREQAEELARKNAELEALRRTASAPTPAGEEGRWALAAWGDRAGIVLMGLGALFAVVVIAANVYHCNPRLDAGASVVTATSPVVHRTGSIRRVTGSAPVEHAGHCTVDVWIAWSGADDCLVRVRCNGIPIYGDDARNDGWNQCRVGEDGVPTAVSDEGGSSIDTDPVLRLDLDAGTAEIGDVDAEGAWSVEIALDPA